MAIVQLINSFNAGELSPFLSSRVDLEKYRNGCQQLQNFIILPYGGAIRRPGTEYRNAAKHADKRGRLIGFNFSTTTNFILEFGEGYIRFWSRSTGQRIEKGSAPAWVTATAYAAGSYVTQGGTIYYCLTAHTSGTFATNLAEGKWLAQTILEVPTPYTEAQLRDLQYVQINDLMYIVHPGHAPRKLSRLADDDWKFEEVPWTWPAFLDENTEATTLTARPTATTAWVTSQAYVVGNYVLQGGIVYRCLIAHTSGTFTTDKNALKWAEAPSLPKDIAITLTASADLFESAHVGSYWSIAHRRNTAYVEQVLNSTDGNSASLEVLGDWELTTYGRWDGRLKVERSYDSGATWETLRTYESSSEGERNVSTTGKEEKQCQLRLNWDGDAAGTSSPNARLEAGDNRIHGVVRITGFTSATSVTATVVNPLQSTTATKIWAEGAFSTKRGFPRTVALHEQRLVFGGTLYRPLTLWGSVVDDFDNFRYTTNDDGAFLFSLSANESNPIQWLMSQGALLIGTAGDEWTLGASDDAQVLSPTNVRAKRQSSYGSKYLQARIVNEVILFTQRQGRKVRELTYSFEKDGWVAPDLTVLAEHISGGEIVESAFQQQPDAIYWAITGSGGLVGMTYERDQNVVGWHRHTTQGEFESVATVYGGGGADEVWFLVRRVVDGQIVRYVERFKPDFRQTLEAEDKPAWWYLDCAKQFTFEPKSAAVSGLAHLEGLEVSILGDGAVQPVRTVDGGAITLQREAAKALVGLSYESILSPMKLEAALQDGTAQGRPARVPRLVTRFYKSLNCEYSADGVEWDKFYFRDSSMPMGDSPPPFTGDKEVYTGANWADGAEVWLRQTSPLPLCVLAIIPKWDVGGD